MEISHSRYMIHYGNGKKNADASAEFRVSFFTNKHLVASIEPVAASLARTCERVMRRAGDFAATSCWASGAACAWNDFVPR